jgi:hypothetical protein
MANNSDYIYTMEKATAIAEALNPDSDDFRYHVVVLPNGMAKIDVYDELNELVGYW